MDTDGPLLAGPFDLAQCRLEALQRRASAQAEFDAGRRLDFLAATREVRESEWSVAPAPVDLRDRRVELRGPVDREPLLAALRSEGIAIRTGHHCAQPVMERFGIPATARASLAFYNTPAEIDVLIHGLAKVRELFG